MKGWKWLVGLLAVTLLFSSCAAVPSDGKAAGQGEDMAGESEAGEGAAYPYVEKIKYDRTLSMLVLNDTKTQMIPLEEEKGETLTDELFERNMRLMDDFGVTLQVQEGGDYEGVIAAMSRQVSGRLDDYDVFANQLYAFTGNALKNQALDLGSIPTMDLEGEWWDQACREALVVDGNNFMMTGDIYPSSLLYSACLIFNKRFMDDLHMAYPYDMVRDSEWTLDAFLRLVEQGSNESTGTYGLSAFVWNAPYSLFYGSGETYVHFNDAGEPYVTYDRNKVINVYEKVYDILITSGAFLGVHYETQFNTYIDLFKNGKALFFDATVGEVSSITDMVDDYGVVPVPKYSVEQKEYLSFVNGAAVHVMIATSERDTEFVGAMLEALATYNYDNVSPELYNVVIKSKDIRDPDSAEMVDYIIRNRIYDYAYWANMPLANMVRDELSASTPVRSIVSKLQSRTSATKSQIQKILWDWERIMQRKNT